MGRVALEQKAERWTRALLAVAEADAKYHAAHAALDAHHVATIQQTTLPKAPTPLQFLTAIEVREERGAEGIALGEEVDRWSNELDDLAAAAHEEDGVPRDLDFTVVGPTGAAVVRLCLNEDTGRMTATVQHLARPATEAAEAVAS